MKVFDHYDINIEEHEDYKKRPKKEIFWDELEKILKKMEVSPLYQSFKHFPTVWKILGTLRFRASYNCPRITTDIKNGIFVFNMYFYDEQYEPLFTVRLDNKGTITLTRILHYYNCYNHNDVKKENIPWEIPDPWPTWINRNGEEIKEEVEVEKTFLTFSPSLFVKYL